MGAACVSLLKVNIVDVTFERNAKKAEAHQHHRLLMK